MPERPPKVHVFIFDGTLSQLRPGYETNAGLLYKLLTERGAHSRQSVGYDEGIQGVGTRKWLNVAMGLTINNSIMEGYAALCSRYQPGDKIMLFGYSRGAYAARSLAGFIGRIGLLRRRHAMHRRVERAFRYYENDELSPQAEKFSERYCRTGVQVEMIGVWDTVRALGLPYPILNRLAPMATEFHDHNLGGHVANAFQALALDENRTAFRPILWEREPGWKGHLEQMWFAGTHPDIGGQVGGQATARPLSNIPLVWMLRRAEMCGLHLPPDWENRLETDPAAPMRSHRKGWSKYFIFRAPRIAGASRSEQIHVSVHKRTRVLARYKPKAKWVDGEAPKNALHSEQVVSG